VETLNNCETVSLKQKDTCKKSTEKFRYEICVYLSNPLVELVNRNSDMMPQSHNSGAKGDIHR
jgi:hypothetical protein